MGSNAVASLNAADDFLSRNAAIGEFCGLQDGERNMIPGACWAEYEQIAGLTDLVVIPPPSYVRAIRRHSRGVVLYVRRNNRVMWL